jgi:hypothetical protein
MMFWIVTSLSKGGVFNQNIRFFQDEKHNEKQRHDTNIFRTEIENPYQGLSFKKTKMKSIKNSLRTVSSKKHLFLVVLAVLFSMQPKNSQGMIPSDGLEKEKNPFSFNF